MKIEDIVQGLNQAAALTYDGALDKDGERIKSGLASAEGHPILDKRVIDGFKVKFGGKKMWLTYEVQCSIKDVHTTDIEKEVIDRIEEIVSYLKKQYRILKGESVSLKLEDEMKITMRHISNYKTWIEANACYEIGNITDYPEDKDEAKIKLTKAIEDWIEQGYK